MLGSGGPALRSLGSVGSVGAIEGIDRIDRIDVSVGVTVGGFLDGCYGDARVRCASRSSSVGRREVSENFV